MIPSFALAVKVEEAVAAAIRLAEEGAIIRIEGTCDGVRFVVAVGAGKGATNLDRIVDASGPLDPRSITSEDTDP